MVTSAVMTKITTQNNANVHKHVISVYLNEIEIIPCYLRLFLFNAPAAA